MKQLKHFLFVMAVALSLVGCQKPIEVSFETSTQEMDAQGGTIEIALTSNGDWTIETNANWVVVSPMSGKGNATLTITSESNTTGSPRSAEIKALTKDNTAVLTLAQGVSQNYISVTPKEIMCGSEGGEFAVELSSNIDWVVTVPQWITCSQMEGSNNARVVLTVSPIEGELAEARETLVSFGNLSSSDKVHVVQSVEPVLGIEIMPNNLDFVCTGETKTVTVITEDVWMASVDEDWVSLSQNEGQGDTEISVTLGENPVYVDRYASVVFTTAGGVQTRLAIRQDASPDPHFLEVSPLAFEFDKEGGERTISIGCVGPFIGIPVPITVIQMLWINMIMDTLSGLAFSYEPALLEYMQESPKKKSENIINKYMISQILVTGLYSSIICIFFLNSNLINRLYTEESKMTAFFGLLIFISIFNSLSSRTYRLNIFSNITKNKVFISIIIFITIIQIILIYYGGTLFRTHGLNIKEFIYMFILSITVLPVDFIRKIYLKRKKEQLGT